MSQSVMIDDIDVYTEHLESSMDMDTEELRAVATDCSVVPLKDNLWTLNYCHSEH